jgi:hypothetical protein
MIQTTTNQIPNADKGSNEEKSSSAGIQGKQEPQTEWLKKLIEQAPQLIDRYLTNSKQKDEARERRLNLISRHNRRLTYSLIVSLSIIIGIMAILTYFNKVSGDALLFLVGTITGYVLFMIQNLTIPMYEEEENE